MKTSDPYLLVHNLGLVQRQAGVDEEVAELVCAYGRLCADTGRPLEFFREDAVESATPPSFLHAWLAERNPDMDGRFFDFLTRYGNALAARRLPIVYCVEHLARKREMSEKRLQWLAHNVKDFYREFSIPKADGRERRISAPSGDLLTMQRWILRHILDRRAAGSSAMGFVKGRSVLSNALRHVGRKVVVTMDLEDFFPSVTHRQVRKMFEKIGYPYRVAVVLANLCTVDGGLPQGAPTSPALSNFACERMDGRFEALGKKLGFRYTRYADDITISSDDGRLPKLLPFFRQVVRECGFRVNEKKVRVARAGSRQTVTGLVVNEKVGLPREQVRRLRAATHRLRTMGPEAVAVASRRGIEADPMAVYEGHMSYLRMVSGDRTYVAEGMWACKDAGKSLAAS